MTKAEETKARIVEQAAILFNQRGYAGSSLSDIMTATGLKKGGIYNHFSSKDELAIAAFDFAVQRAREIHLQALKDGRGAIARLQSMTASFVEAFDVMSAMGGCPLLNTAVDSDDAHPVLRERTQQAMGEWRQLIRRIVQKGIQRREIHSDTDPDAVATVLIATLEGSLMLAKLYGDRTPMEQAQEHLNIYIDSLQLALDSS
ncbi:MAG: TetR family transcriptional regulator C-terminal domain-containing protein [Leptolyngbyaceae cyanobacterium]